MQLLIITVMAALAGNPQLASTNAPSITNLSLSALLPKNDPVERDYRRLLEMDDDAQTEVDQWIKEDEQFKEKGVQSITLRARILQRFEPVKKAYEEFLRKNPNHVEARIAYGSFLNDINEEENAEAQWQKAREIAPANPAVWNNLANFYGHNGNVQRAFDYYAKAIELNPKETVYYQNFATTVYMFRRDAMEHYKITEEQVFQKAMALYYKALDLDPQNFVLAADVAQSYYGIKPKVTGDAEADKKAADKQTDEAIAAWLKALQLARDETERQGVYVHLARVQINAGRLDGAKKNLDSVTNDMFSTTKKLLLKKLTKMEGTNAPSTTTVTQPAK
jgi:tetratricopeptide (TPR) repeat protein